MAATPLLSASGGVIPSEWKSTRRVYHVNERSAGPVPRNMDTADLRGDMYFEMHSLVLPLECQLAYRPFECENAEVVSPDLVVNELVLEVDARFGPYGRCNVCENGTDHHGDDHCADGEYVCNCGDSAAPEPCGARVGFANLTEATTKYCASGDQDWRCWQDTVIQKVEPAAWYSTTAAGHCDGAPEGPCAWRVANVSKVVNKTCADGVRFAAVEALGAAHFANCSSGAARNASSHCWLAAFFATVLGPGCAEPDCVVRGAPLADLEAAWARPFRDVAAGGCPDLTGEG